VYKLERTIVTLKTELGDRPSSIENERERV
jgi:hypothetical protein